MLGTHLVADELPRKSDVIVVLAGDDYGYRILKAGQLVREGWAPFALVNGTPFLHQNHADLAIAFAVDSGFPPSYFRKFGREMNSTREETTDTAGWLRSHGMRHILLVTSNYHTRRAGKLMRLAAPGIEIHTIAAPDRYFSPDAWWKTRGGQRTFLLEWTKTISTDLGN